MVLVLCLILVLSVKQEGLALDTTAADRRRRRARLHLCRTAVALFAEQGYAETTTEQVAAAADVSRSTLFRHARDKEDLVFGLEDENIEAARAAAGPLSVGHTVTDTLEQAAAQVASGLEPLREFFLQRAEVVATSPALQARAAAKNRRWEAVVAQIVAERYRLAPDDALLLASVTVSCFTVAEGRWLADPTASFPDLVHQTFTRLRVLLENG